MLPIRASVRGVPSVVSIVAPYNVSVGFGQKRMSGSPVILLLPPDQASSMRSIVGRTSVVEMTSGRAALYPTASTMPIAAGQRKWRRRSRDQRRELPIICRIFLVISAWLPIAWDHAAWIGFRPA
ncbi:hypothetical protein D9M69_600680 [compost metagenome]